MRHTDVVALQLALVDRFTQPLELDIPGYDRHLITPEMREMAMASPAYQARSRSYRQMAAALESCDAWHVGPEITDLLAEASLSLPPTTAITETMLPAPQALIVFDQIVRFPTVTIGGFAWRVLPDNQLMLVMLHGHTMHERVEVTDTVPYGVALRETGLPSIDRTMPAFRLLASALLLIEQRIITPAERREVANRAARKRLSRGRGTLPAVRVVRLVERSTPTASDESRPVDWSHRWMVRGHWRNQWYPKTRTHRPVYVLPYVKGPDDKPLVIRRTVVDVS